MREHGWGLVSRTSLSLTSFFLVIGSWYQFLCWRYCRLSLECKDVNQHHVKCGEDEKSKWRTILEILLCIYIYDPSLEPFSLDVCFFSYSTLYIFLHNFLRTYFTHFESWMNATSRQLLSWFFLLVSTNVRSAERMFASGNADGGGCVKKIRQQGWPHRIFQLSISFKSNRIILYLPRFLCTL